MSNIVRHPQWPPQHECCECGDPQCDGRCRCGPSVPNWSTGFLSCWGQIAQLENAMTVVMRRLIMDPSSGVMDAILKQISISDIDVPGSGGSTGGGGSTSGSSVTISTSPPGNPVAGMQWWNGSILQVYDGTKWNTIGPGSAAAPYPTTTKTFQIGNTATMSVTAATWTIVPFVSAPTIDTLTGWDGITRMYRPTKAGIYLFLLRVPISTSSGTIGIGLLKNDTGVFSTNEEYVAITTEGQSAAASGWLGAMGVAVMNGTTDFVRLWGYSTSGGGVISASNQSFFQAYTLP